MDWFKKTEAQEVPERPAPVKAPEPFNPPKFVKTEAHCEVDGCEETKAIGQNHVCLKHQRSS